jgi:hypothetical protein
MVQPGILSTWKPPGVLAIAFAITGISKMLHILYTRLVLVLFQLFMLIGGVFLGVALYSAPMNQIVVRMVSVISRSRSTAGAIPWRSSQLHEFVVKRPNNLA